MTRQSQRHRTRSLPFPYIADGLDFTIEAYALDDGEFRATEFKPGERELNLAPDTDTTPDETWDTATIKGTLTLPETVVEEVLPADERDAPPTKLYVAKRCHETIYRDRIDVADAPVPPGDYDVEFELDRERYRGEIELRPYLVRRKDRDDIDRYAGARNVRLSDDAPFYIGIDRPADEEPPAIDGEAVRFSQEPHLPDGEKLYHVDFRNDARPKLWLNADYPRITDVLQSRGSVGTEPRMRDVVLDQISYGVWSQLIVRAVTGIDRDGEVEHEWQETVLETFGRGLTDRSNLESAKQELRATAADPDRLPDLMASLDSELQEYIEPRTQLINLMEEGLQL
jgi:hypothetical protein